MDKLSDYDYHLPEEAIAQTPLENREDAKLLWLKRNGTVCTHHCFSDIPEFFERGDLLVLNDTRVTALRLWGRKSTGACVEALLLEEGKNSGEYVALMKPGKRLQPGSRVIFEDGLEAIVGDDLGEGRKLLQFDVSRDLKNQLVGIGQTPLPPYIRKQLSNAERYQTVYAIQGGSAAAPTAGLHFTPRILEALQAKGVGIAYVTLSVGMDTFRPIQVEDLNQVQMHGEYCELTEGTAQAIADCRGRIIAVGTTTVRTLETFAMGKRLVRTGKKLTDIFIKPGFEYKIIDGMFTNFHMPKTTMLLMISALVNREGVLRAYNIALENKYRFLSFGDSMLIL